MHRLTKNLLEDMSHEILQHFDRYSSDINAVPGMPPGTAHTVNPSATSLDHSERGATPFPHTVKPSIHDVLARHGYKHDPENSDADAIRYKHPEGSSVHVTNNPISGRSMIHVFHKNF